MSKLIPTVYRTEVKEGVYDRFEIARVPAFVSPIGDEPAFWYVRRIIRYWDGQNAEETELIKLLKERGYEYLYWTDKGWWYHTPKQYPSAEEAYEEFVGNGGPAAALPSIPDVVTNILGGPPPKRKTRRSKKSATR